MASGKNVADTESVAIGRRKVLGVMGAGALSSALGGILGTESREARAAASQVLRWGVVGTGGIASRTAPMIQLADNAELVAVSSRKMETARLFAHEHAIDATFDSWAEMCAWDGVDAIYVATPTAVREEICLAAAANGKHVLAEKPFSSLPSLQRITKACRRNGVGFMDGTHFVHHPRTAHIKAATMEKLGRPWSVASAFQFNLSDTNNIRLRPDLEPYGAIGDAGWYNMRAAVEFLSPEVRPSSACSRVRRHSDTNAVISASGVVAFDDRSTTTWNCGFESGVLNMDLRISAAGGVIKLDDFVLGRMQEPARYQLLTAGDPRDLAIPTPKPAAALMFEDFAAMTKNQESLQASVHASERTQELLDAIWQSVTAGTRT